MLDAAEVLLKGGSTRAAILVAAAALDARRDFVESTQGGGSPGSPDTTPTLLETLRASVVAGRPVTVGDAEAAIETVRAVLA
jgi:hypothetical protein